MNLSIPFAVFAGGSGDGHIDWLNLLFLAINFAIFAFLVPKIWKFFTDRSPKEAMVAYREDMARQIAEAQTKQAEAEARLAEYVKKLDNLESEVAAIVKNFEAQGDADRKKIEDEAGNKIERASREADFTLRQESLKAQKEIRAVAIETTLRMAEALVTERITDADRRRLADEYIGSVEQQNGAV